MAHYQTMTSDKNKDTALLLCIFGGWFGLHQYYVGNIGKGLIYTFTFGLFMIGWILDIFRILLGSFRDNTGAPLRANKKQNNVQRINSPSRLNNFVWKRSGVKHYF